ncbi:hypothetical protein ACFWOJ_24470 [Streptomyces sp. NPDC058439]|uniref:hypothetical protein n=1 Tax=Streptomyces sp. NPDC058439 TaxID=3346500 RepID=UPI003650E163
MPAARPPTKALFPALLSGALLLGALGAATAAASTGASPTTRIPAGHGTWSILNYDAQGRRSGILGGSDWRAADWSRLVGAAQKNGPVAAVDT